MGMFDNLYVRCRLRGFPVSTDGHLFQTKSLDCVLDTYFISKDRMLSVTRFWKSKEKKCNFTGALTFYNSNVTAVCKAGYTTSDGKVSRWSQYTATVVKGRVTRITGGSKRKELKKGFRLLTDKEFAKKCL